MGEYEYRARSLFDFLKWGPTTTTLDKLGREIGCGSYTAMLGQVRWMRKNPHRIGFQFPWLCNSPRPQFVGIWYPGMPDWYRVQMDAHDAHVKAQRIEPIIEAHEYGKSISGGPVRPMQDTSGSAVVGNLAALPTVP